MSVDVNISTIAIRKYNLFCIRFKKLKLKHVGIGPVYT